MTGVIAAIAGGKGFVPLDVVASNVSRTQAGSGPEGTVTTTQSPSATATGGVAPYVTWLWTYVSGSTDFGILDANVQSPVWEGVISETSSQSAVWRVTVTDTAGATDTFDITVTLTWVQI